MSRVRVRGLELLLRFEPGSWWVERWGAIMCAWWRYWGWGHWGHEAHPYLGWGVWGSGIHRPIHCHALSPVPPEPREASLTWWPRIQSSHLGLSLYSCVRADFRSWPKEEPVHPLAMSEVLPHETSTQAGIPLS